MQEDGYPAGWGGAQQHGAQMGMYGMGGYGCQYMYASPAYWMAGYAAGPSASIYGNMYAAAGGSAFDAAARMQRGGASAAEGGRKGDYRNLLEEMKAKQARRDEHRKLSEQVARCKSADGRERDALQQRIYSLEHELWLMGESSCGSSSGGGSCSSADALRPPDDGRADQFGRLCHALAEFLRSQQGHACLLSSAEAERKVQQEWKDLLRSRVVSQSTRLKHLLQARPGLFELTEEPDGGQPRVRLVGEPDPREAASRSDSSSVPAGRGAGPAAAPAVQLQLAGKEELRGLEQMLQRLTKSREAVGDAMVFCIDNGTRHAAAFARALTKALEEPDLGTDAVLARFFLISDVLYNSNACASGASRYHSCFQDLLPDASERLGRQWFQCLERGRLERQRAEVAVRHMLGAWQEWAVFPPLFCRGLEALLFAPVAVVDSLEALGSRALQEKVARWRSPGEAARLPYAARLRGLSGPSPSPSECRARLCHYECYWHGAEGPEGEDSIDGESLSDSDAAADASDEEAPAKVPAEAPAEVPGVLPPNTRPRPLCSGEEGDPEAKRSRAAGRRGSDPNSDAAVAERSGESSDVSL